MSSSQFPPLLLGRCRAGSDAEAVLAADPGAGLPWCGLGVRRDELHLQREEPVVLRAWPV
eukprot:8132718-Lingulodinium_polyedra.AAC.1